MPRIYYLRPDERPEIRQVAGDIDTLRELLTAASSDRSIGAIA